MLVKALEERAASASDLTALECEGVELTFREAHEQANRLARHLVAQGVGPDRVVAVMLPRSTDLLVALLAVLKAGGAYLALDPEHPAERVDFQVRDAAPVVLLTSTRIPADRTDLGVPRVVLDDPATAATLAGLPAGHLTDAERAAPPGPEDLAYVIYTSGSTGTPKGVEIPVRALHNLLEAMRERLAMQPGERMLSVTTATFDMSVPELFLPYYTGARAVIAPRATGQDPQALGDLIVRGGIGTAQATPTHWHMLATVCPEALRGLRILIGGEALSEKLAAALLDLGAEVVQWYGPTETTVWSTVHPVTGPEDAAVIGKALRNTRLYVLDEELAPVEAGAEGELFIAGAGVARGYLNRPELTAERFLPDRFGDGLMYRTGDVVRLRPDGDLEYVGRADHQVKLHGFRMELGEIEAVLERSEDVDQAAATVREDRPGDRRLVAYVTAAPGREPDVRELRDFVADALPLYMVPSAVVVLEEFPLTPNGKLDRKALPAPVVARTAMVETHLTQSELLLGRLFAEVLGVEQVGPRDSFFDLGGSSVLAARLLARVRSEMHLELSIRMLVESPTPAELSRRLTGEEPQDSFDVLLPLMTRGTARPLFCMRHLGGTAWCYGVLAQHFSLDYPLYGLQSHTFQEYDHPVDSIAAMAADYADRISGVQPTGPYRLLGWSFGGILAHAVAAEFQKRGEEVEFLGVFNTNPHITAKEDRDEQGLIELILLINGKDLAEYRRPLSYDDVAEFADMATNYAWRGRKSAAETFVETMLTDLGAWKAHTPEKYSGAMHLFAADPSPVAEAASSEAWAPYVAGEIVRHELGCGHEEMLSSPRVLRQVAQIVTDHLRD
ncbi:amino acid adenylation domain-containing protein [Streptomyces hilarionis]|uniref:amino acid adenylation domain-containing protein n=1 Tax=Streptomyces hilarionis TaxID=2839954 RepID=UPI00211A91FB|nr:amino acid adenylation domain-containing protein [Streptomyces hilarionis]MCQ9133916.1 amino acid adenylation domain-containing protein [Streptomyces hilarionis]